MDALTSNICVVDASCVIVAANRAWNEFGANNTGTVHNYVGVNYLEVCRNATGPDSEEAQDVMVGMLAVLKGELELFQIEYPCHSPSELRWFLAKFTPLRPPRSTRKAKIIGAVVSHMDITDRKLVELDYARLAATDPLTGLPNRRFVDEYSEVELARFRRFGQPASLLMIDLDKFKSINDTYGHPSGDRLLQAIAACCKDVVRSVDLFARFGGEEFLCLLPGTDAADATAVAEKIRAAIGKVQVKVGSESIGTTASIGVAALRPDDQSIGDVIARADEALYRAKNDGRNCIRSSS
jgi:diguanylate cyclase (GGDEF)-like protein